MIAGTSSSSTRTTRLAALLVCVAAVVPYISTLNGYFVRDDFGVVQLLASKPGSYFPRWFVSSWMDRIWGYNPDEIRPFPAASYQLTALGGAASPFLHHALNVLIHAANGLLVMALARIAAGLSLPAATFAGIVFVLLPVNVESVAWITGRVDSMPAFFYLATFLAYVLWRQRASTGWYLGSLVLFFVALFTKQNTITMVGTLAAYDVIVGRRPLLPPVAFIRPYVPFATMTAAYLYLRYALFGEVAREGTLNARGFQDFQVIVARHIRHAVLGDMNGSEILVWIALLALVGVFIVVLRQPRMLRALTYFGPVWWILGIAPILVAGYSSPRHVYLAAVGWAITIGMAFDVMWTARAAPVLLRRGAIAVAALIVAVYSVGLRREVQEYNRSAEVSHRVVRDVRDLALTAKAGTLVIIGAPARSWEWALPFAVQPPFVHTDLRTQLHIISPRTLTCCSAVWFDETRQAIKDWSASGSRDFAVALRWDRDTGALSRATERDGGQLPALVRSLLDMDQPDELDRNLVRILDVPNSADPVKAFRALRPRASGLPGSSRRMMKMPGVSVVRDLGSSMGELCLANKECQPKSKPYLAARSRCRCRQRITSTVPGCRRRFPTASSAPCSGWVLLGCGKEVLGPARRLHDRGRLRRWVDAEPDLPRSLQRHDRPQRSGAGRIRSEADLVRHPAEDVLGESRSDAGHASRERCRHAVPLWRLHLQRGTARGGRAIARCLPGAVVDARLRHDHDGDSPCAGVLLRGGLSPAVPVEES